MGRSDEGVREEGGEVKGEGGERDRGIWRKQVSLSKEPEILP